MVYQKRKINIIKESTDYFILVIHFSNYKYLGHRNTYNWIFWFPKYRYNMIIKQTKSSIIFTKQHALVPVMKRYLNLISLSFYIFVITSTIVRLRVIAASVVGGEFNAGTAMKDQRNHYSEIN